MLESKPSLSLEIDLEENTKDEGITTFLIEFENLNFNSLSKNIKKNLKFNYSKKNFSKLRMKMKKIVINCKISKFISLILNFLVIL